MPPPVILVALELDAKDDAPLVAAARDYAAAFAAQLYLVHVVPGEAGFIGLPKEAEADPAGAPHEPASEPEVGYAYDRSMQARRVRDAHARLQAIGDALARDGLAATALLLEGDPPQKIAAEAKRLRAGLIIIGAHHRGLIASWLSGSTSQAVQRRAPCPLLIVPIVGR